MRMVYLIIGLLTVSAAQTSAQVAEMDISPRMVSEGQAAVLMWDVADAEGVYISSLGEVAASGKVTLLPIESRVYSLVADRLDSVLTLSVILEVEGSKNAGEYECPRDYMFRFPYTYSVAGVKYTHLLDVFHGVLQDSMDFCIVTEHKPHNGPFRFITACSERGYLVGAGERTIGSRRVAYSVEIQHPDRPDSIIEYTVMPAIQYRKKIVRTWRLETADSLYVREARRLNARVRETLAREAER